MIGVDTNVLMRLFLVDDSRQSELAAAFFAKRSPADPAFVSIVVMAELAWVLTRRYGFRFDRVGLVIRGMLDSDDFAIESRDAVELSLSRFDHAKVDFSDLLIAQSNVRAGCSTTVTFDREAAKRVPGMELLK